MQHFTCQLQEVDAESERAPAAQRQHTLSKKVSPSLAAVARAVSMSSGRRSAAGGRGGGASDPAPASSPVRRILLLALLQVPRSHQAATTASTKLRRPPQAHRLRLAGPQLAQARSIRLPGALPDALRTKHTGRNASHQHPGKKQQDAVLGQLAGCCKLLQ